MGWKQHTRWLLHSASELLESTYSSDGSQEEKILVEFELEPVRAAAAAAASMLPCVANAAASYALLYIVGFSGCASSHDDDAARTKDDTLHRLFFEN